MAVGVARVLLLALLHLLLLLALPGETRGARDGGAAARRAPGTPRHGGSSSSPPLPRAASAGGGQAGGHARDPVFPRRPPARGVPHRRALPQPRRGAGGCRKATPLARLSRASHHPITMTTGRLREKSPPPPQHTSSRSPPTPPAPQLPAPMGMSGGGRGGRGAAPLRPRGRGASPGSRGGAGQPCTSSPVSQSVCFSPFSPKIRLRGPLVPLLLCRGGGPARGTPVPPRPPAACCGFGLSKKGRELRLPEQLLRAAPAPNMRGASGCPPQRPHLNTHPPS